MCYYNLAVAFHGLESLVIFDKAKAEAKAKVFINQVYHITTYKNLRLSLSLAERS